MRNIIIGVVLAALFLAGLFALASRRVSSLPEAADRSASEIEPGFTGAKRVGPWMLVCAPADKDKAPLPFSLTPYGKNRPAAEAGLGRCRLTLLFRRRETPKQIAAVLTLRPLKNGRLAFIAIVPPAVKVGDSLRLRVGSRVLPLAVSACATGQCTATAAIARQDEIGLLSSADRGAIILPAANGKRRALIFPLAGVQAAVNAMRRAEI